MGLECKNVSFSWPGFGDSNIIEDLSLRIDPGEFVSLIGPSGCGKSTLLYLLSGLEKPVSGSVLLDGECLDKPQRTISLVFQHYTLLPWLSVQHNVEFGMKLAGLPSEMRREKATDVLKRVGLFQARKKFPHELSGGMQQRTAIARVLAKRLAIPPYG